MHTIPSSLRGTLIGLWSAAALVGVISSLLAPPAAFDLAAWLATILFALGLTIFEALTIVRQHDRPLAVTLVLLISAMIVLPWPLFLLATAIGAVAGTLARQSPWWQALALASIRWIALTAGSVVLMLFVQQHPFGADIASPFALIGLIGCGFVIYSIERVASASLSSPVTDERFLLALRWRIDDAGWYALIFAPLGGMLAILWQQEVWAFALGMAPLAMVQISLRRQYRLEEALRVADTQLQTANARLRTLSRQTDHLHSLIVALMTSRDVPTMLNLLGERLSALMEADCAWVTLYDDQGNLQLVASHHLPVSTEGVGPQPVPLPQAYETALEQKRVTLFTNQQVQMLAPVAALTERSTWQAVIMLPLLGEQAPLGAVCLAFETVRGLKEDEQRLLAAFARHATAVIQNARLFRRWQESQTELGRSAKLAAVGTFAASIAHEFNNLLSGMLGYAQLGLADDDVEMKNEALKVVLDTCKRGRSITGSLLTFARRRDSRRELSDLREVVDGTLTLMEIELRKHNIRVVRQIDMVPPTICDSGQISQVFLNLLTNARDAMKPQGGTLTVSLTSDNEWITLQVTDTGCGIPEAVRRQIFQPFVTTKNTTGSQSGTGLGLAVSYGIIKNHNGHFDVESEVGKGTTMTIRLPIVQEEESETSKAPIPSLRMLVIDDDEAAARTLTALLEQAGHQVTYCAHSAEAVAIYTSNPFDIVLTDVVMPELDGISLLNVLRTYDPTASIILFTGQIEPDQVAAMAASGAYAVLRKPFSAEELMTTVQAAYHDRERAKRALAGFVETAR
ncbi:MAG TPA: histidine kinase [Chloroflexus aurantiacus]|jgi:signal transduction histidine kinase/AmiR/NasT family two-component response regulator|uniref:histidine kinase n=1 Tax=Chloroflexus aurantiacus (strain ATCC 29366 / DSM 635 / J-10-fl) TaxID=324602 RepID=A9WAB1_CHLAA|nr:ATP-binding protein [Chloroflexus aurantiacus]ABY34670.1 Histidine kinase [Chloroflexus aurantiacus J-10-fl]RMG52686.1 MAG: response regulator [Chloroflexota bacterium]HBW67370.1 histidine kinase [Chloroflexus aurantiacus]